MPWLAHYYMKKENWILMLSVISIVLSIIAILIWLCEYHPVTWSLLDSCFAVLSAGMTLFVASQVYHSFTLTRKIEEKNAVLKMAFEEKCENLKSEFKDAFENAMRSYDHNVSALSKQLIAVGHFSGGSYKVALEVFMDALEEANLSRRHEVEGIENPTDGIISYIEEIKRRNPDIKLKQELVEKYKAIFAATGKKGAIDLIPYIQSMLEPINTATANEVAIKTSTQIIKSPASNP